MNTELLTCSARGARFFISLFAFCVLLIGMQPSVLAQQKKKQRKKKASEEQTTILEEGFGFHDTTSILRLPMMEFENINKVTDYYDPAKLAAIKRFAKNRQHNEYFLALYDYVSKFGIGNFIYDMNLIWQLARMAEYKEQMALTRELYRLILKHYRGNLRDAAIKYDSIAGIDLPKYADLDAYYRLVERRMLIDTLQPPAKILQDMGEGVNSKFDDYGITIGGKDDRIYFTSSRPYETSRAIADLKGPSALAEDIYFSEKDYGSDTWGQAKAFKGINTPHKEGSPCMSKDGKTIVFARCNAPNGLGNCDLYISEFNEADSTWGEAVNLGENVNSYAWDSHPAFSITEDTLFFSSDRKGGFGGTDLYFSIRDQESGAWGKAQNLGPTINTRNSEVSPYPHPKYNVLYFSSNGQILNFGDFDIYKTYQIDGGWTEPKNIGPLVNGESSEFYFTIDSKSKWLFYAKSNSPNGKNLDLKSFPLPMEAKPNSVIRFSGRLVEPTTGAVFEGVVTIIDLDEGVEVAPRKVREDGTFEFELIDKRNYLVMIEGDNFFKIEEVFYLDGDTEMDFEAQSIRQTISFENIDFEANSSELKPDMENNLHLVVEFLVTYPHFNLKITGHTDSVGDEGFNLKLSQDRADVIKSYIVSYGGLSPDRVEAIGMGEQDPIVPEEKTEMDRKMNRRVEFELYRTDTGEKE